MNIFKRLFKPASKLELQQRLVVLESKKDSLETIFKLPNPMPLYMIEEWRDLKSKIAELKFCIENYDSN